MKKIRVIPVAYILVINLNVCAQSNAPVAPRTADSLFFNMRYEQAIPQYQQYLKSNPAAANASLARLAFCYHFTGNFDEAIKHYNLVLSKKPTPPLKAVLFSRMAMTYARKNNVKAALTWLDSANANGYANTYEMEHSNDLSTLKSEPRFNEIYNQVYLRAYPCKSRAEARAFDFWIGEWDVYNNQYPNQRVGDSKIENVSGECTILENWQSYNNAFSGKSQNWYDPNTKKWTQLWIGSGGGHQYFTDGEYKDGAMRFKLQQPDANGVMQPGNFYFYNLGPNKVRQYQDISADGGKTFTVVYDFIYIRKQNEEEKLRSINEKYVSNWLKNDEAGVLSLFTADATLAPSGLKPVKGINEIKEFWFPKDGSTTTIEKFTNDITHVYIDGGMAETSQIDYLKWSYKKGTQSISREQWGFATTIYKKQANGEWKIIHQMWKDYKVNDLLK